MTEPGFDDAIPGFGDHDDDDDIFGLHAPAPAKTTNTIIPPNTVPATNNINTNNSQNAPSFPINFQNQRLSDQMLMQMVMNQQQAMMLNQSQNQTQGGSSILGNFVPPSEQQASLLLPPQQAPQPTMIMNYQQHQHQHHSQNSFPLQQQLYHHHHHHHNQYNFQQQQQQQQRAVFRDARPATNTVFIKNLDTSRFTEEIVRKMVEPYGKVLKVDIKAFKGMGFIHYRTVEEALDCVEALSQLTAENSEPGGKGLNRGAILAYGRMHEYDQEGRLLGPDGAVVKEQGGHLYLGSNVDPERAAASAAKAAPAKHKVTPLSQEELDFHRNVKTGEPTFRYRIGTFKVRNDPSTCVFVSGIQIVSDETREEVANFFGQFAGFDSITSNSRVSNGIVFAHFETVDDAVQCIGSLWSGGNFILGKKCTVDFGRPKNPADPFVPASGVNRGGRRRDRGDELQQQQQPEEYNQGDEGGGITMTHHVNLHHQHQQEAHHNANSYQQQQQQQQQLQQQQHDNYFHHRNALVALPSESTVGDGGESGRDGTSIDKKPSASMSELLKPKYYTRDRAKAATTISSTILLDDEDDDGSKQHTRSSDEITKSKKITAINTKISGLLTFSYFSCGLFPPHLPPELVVSIANCVDSAYPNSIGDDDDDSSSSNNMIDISTEPLINELDEVIQLNNYSGGYLPHAIAVVTKRIKEHFFDDNVKKLHVFYLVATALFKNASLQNGVVGKGLEQFAWLAAVVADGQTEQAAFAHIKTICEGMKESLMVPNHEALEMLDAVIDVKIAVKVQVSDLLAQLNMFS